MDQDHKTVNIYSPFENEYISIDEEISDLIKVLWTAGIDTDNSCQDNPTGFIWLEFASVDNAERFINLIRKPLYKSEPNFADWLFSRIEGGEGKQLKPWKHKAILKDSGHLLDDEYHSKQPEYYSISIRFPKEDYREVIRLLSQ